MLLAAPLILKFLPSEDRLIRESGIDGYAQCIAVDEQPPTRLRIEGKSEVEYERKNELLRHRCDGHHVGDRVRNIVPTSCRGRRRRAEVRSRSILAQNSSQMGSRAPRRVMHR